MASRLSQFSSPSCICMPLAKFSYATVHTGNTGPIPWTHLASQDDLFLLIGPVNVENPRGTSETRWKLKVLQDPNFHVSCQRERFVRFRISYDGAGRYRSASACTGSSDSDGSCTGVSRAETTAIGSGYCQATMHCHAISSRGQSRKAPFRVEASFLSWLDSTFSSPISAARGLLRDVEDPKQRDCARH